MTLGLVFSRDRALQLQAALDSFLRRAGETAGLNLVVLYRASSARFEAQYAQLARDYSGRVRLVAETDFHSQVLGVVGETAQGRSNVLPTVSVGTSVAEGARPAISGPRSAAYVLFFVDDTLFTAPFRLEAAIDALSANPDALGFSMRLGRNTTDCYALARPQGVPAFHELPDGLLKFDWTRADGDFGYPLEISSSIYWMETISKLLGGLDFSDPNSLEGQMALQSRHFARKWPSMLCPAQSWAFNNPINRVQEIFPNRSGQAPQYSTDALARRFDLGQRINVDVLKGFVPSGCHQEVEFEFEPTVR